MIKKGLSQKEVSKRLGITPSAVSQYISKKRGSRLGLQDDVKDEIRGLAEDIIQDRIGNPILRICKICMMLRADGTICGLDKCGADEDCDICLK